jgi:hypothetical protein
MERAAPVKKFIFHVAQKEIFHVAQKKSDSRWASVLRSQSERPGSSVGWQCRRAATANRPAIRIEPAIYPQVSQEIKKEFRGWFASHKIITRKFDQIQWAQALGTS